MKLMESFRRLLNKSRNVKIESEKVNLTGVQMDSINCDIMYLVSYDDNIQVMPLYTLARILDGLFYDEMLFDESEILFNSDIKIKLES
jgi:hypothetical protein